ncbi:hypothetical protein QE152_g25562 [Popillia japonica]|uniref:Transposable element P transposase-like GTP-binding insertion domain-containing protein n=1 Tax=Popillia japonica TaxID=7064 RepID=A0AAW1K137_POPJA
MLTQVIRKCQNIGLEVMVTICDQETANQAAINSLLRSRNEECQRNGVKNTYGGFLINAEEIIPLFDVPHLFKGIRNNLLSKDLQFEEDGEIKIAKWDHVKQFYLLDSLDDTRLCKKLSDAHVFPQKMDKMKVSLMTQVFSQRVGSLMKRICQWGKLHL